MKEKDNPIIITDAYKFSHFNQYREGTTRIFSYLEARGGKWKKTVPFGNWYYVYTYINMVVTRKDVDEAEFYANLMGIPFNRAGWLYIVDNLGGRLPLHIRAVPEGTVIPTGNILMRLVVCRSCQWMEEATDKHRTKKSVRRNTILCTRLP